MPAATPFSAPQPQFSRRPRRGVQSIARSRLACSRLACLLAVTCCASGSLRAESWSGATGSEWNVAGNWTPATVPNATDATATFPAAATVNLTTFTATVGTLDATLTSGNLVLGDAATTDDILNLATFTGTPTMNVAGGGTIFMYANLTGSQGFKKTGGGLLTFRFHGTTQAYTGDVDLGGGTLGLQTDGNLGDAANDIVVSANSAINFATSGTTPPAVTLNAGRQITINSGVTLTMFNNGAANAGVIDGPIIGSGNLTYSGSNGSLTLNGSNSYAGTTTLTNGAALTLGSGGTISTATLAYTGNAISSLDLGGTSQTIANFSISGQSAAFSSPLVSNGSLTINGDANQLFTNALDGTVYDLSGLSNFTFARSNRNFTVYPTTTPTTAVNTLELAAGTNSITAASVQVGGASGTSQGTAFEGRMLLGETNTINAGTLQIGGFNGSGLVDLQTGLAAPTATLRGTAGGSDRLTDLIVGFTSSGVRTGEGVLDLAGATVDALVGTLTIGRHIPGSSNAQTSSVTISAGTLDATSIVIGEKQNNGSPVLTDSLNQSGGTVTAGTITLGTNSGGQTPTFASTYALSGGTLRAGTLTVGTGTANAASSRTLAWTGGTIRNYDASTDLTISGTGSGAGQMQITLPSGTGQSFEADAGRTITLGSNTALTGSGGITKTGTGSLVVGVDAAYTGATAVNAGTLRVGGALSGTSGVTIAAGALLAGSGTVAATIGGAGTIGPGNSPGILTALQADPSAGLDFDFEFTQANADPTWSNATASVNDVLRLTDSVAPFTASLAAPNNVNVFLGVSSLTQGDTFTGGFFTDASADFLATVQAATFVYYVEGNGGGSAITSNGTSYYSLAQFDPSLSIDVSTVQIGSANFSSGTITNGYSTEFVVVPEPGSLVALGLAGGLIALRLRRRRHAA